LSGAAEALVAMLARGSEAVVLAASRGAADDFVRSACHEATGVHRVTLRQLAARLAMRTMAERAMTPLGGLATEAVAARITYLAHSAGRLDYFNPVAAMPGFPRALASTLSELRLERIAAERMQGRAESDLAVLLRLYEEELRERAFADEAQLFEFATEVACRSSHRLLGLPLVLVDVALEARAHRQFLEAVAACAPEVFATVLAADDAGRQALEETLAVGAQEEECPPEEGVLGRLRTYLFSSEPPPRAGDRAELFSAPGEALECVEIARRIRGLINEGFTFDRIAVLLRSPERYQPLMEEALRRAGIPAYFTRGARRPDPAGRAFLALLECAREGCTASRFAEYLSLGQVPAVDEGGAPPQPRDLWVAAEDDVLSHNETVSTPEPDARDESHDSEAPVSQGRLRAPFGWEKLLVDAAVIGGRDRWARRLKGLEQELRLKLTDPNEATRSHVERQLEDLLHLERFALPLVEFLANLPARAQWREWLARLSELAQMALARPESVLSVLSELEPMSEVGPVELAEVATVLSERLRYLRREPPRHRYGRIFIGTLEEARGRSFEVVFVPGLAEGLFPRKTLEDPLLLDESRARMDAGLRLRPDGVARERWMLRNAAGVAERRFIASYPRMDIAQSRPRVPSFYAMEIVRAAEGVLPDLEELQKHAAQQTPSRLGWPAPQNPSDALDVTEYDLAYLGGCKARGSGRYLVEVAPALARSLRTRWRRWREPWTAADGIVDPAPVVLRVLEEQRLARRPWSPTTLQHFAQCPYRFLLHGIHRLRVREEAVALEQMDPLTRGALFHQAQFALYGKLDAAGLLPVTPANLEAIVEIADQVLSDVSERNAEILAPAIPRVWETEIEELRTDLRGWLRQIARSGGEWRPVRFEYSFGMPVEAGHDPASQTADVVVLDALRLKGSIDVVEENLHTGALRVTDHKTGKAPERPPAYVGGGATLQPLLYALAAEQLFEKPVASGRLFFCTERGSYTECDVALTQQSRAWIRRALEIIDASIGSGFLAPAPQKDACAYCDYRLVCGPYEETRLSRKQRDRLEALQDLRSLP
jgi:CRISPR/Cas system-associated exonuclease Cas4 (RecB family)